MARAVTLGLKVVRRSECSPPLRWHQFQFQFHSHTLWLVETHLERRAIPSEGDVGASPEGCQGFVPRGKSAWQAMPASSSGASMSKTDFVTPQDAALVLIDYQPA